MYVVAGREFDESRNTSRVLLPPPTALPNAMQALRILRGRAPRLVAWVLDGHPSLTHGEHVERFGRPYRRDVIA